MRKGEANDDRLKRFVFTRIVLATLCCSLLAALAVRNAFVSAYAETNPDLAMRIWPNHPDVMTSVAMAEVGQAAARLEEPSNRTLKRLEKLASIEPLATEPFLVRAAIASRNGDHATTQRTLEAALRRDPRSVAARYLLIDSYLRAGTTRRAIEELVILTRIAPTFSPHLVPMLAQHAQALGNGGHLRNLIQSAPHIENALLTALASDPANTALILSLASEGSLSDQQAAWKQKLVAALIEAEQYDRASSVWKRLNPTNGRTDSLVFLRSDAPSPFTWTFAQRAGGTAEPVNERLDVVFSETENVTLASKMILLEAGSHTLHTRWTGEPGPGLTWTVNCLPNKKDAVSLPLATSIGTISRQFQIPAECPAQQVLLKGEGQTFPTRRKFTITEFKIVEGS